LPKQVQITHAAVVGVGRKESGVMPVVICEECRQSVTVTVTGNNAAAYQFDLNRCIQKGRPSTPAERFVDSTRCPRLEAAISTARQRGAI